MHHTLWVLTGPTASDKTEIGFNVAREINGEIISADSMLFYRGMDIGTAKPSLSMRERVPHHFIDIIDPWESYSVGKYVKDVEDLIGDADSKERKFLIVGGSPLYIKSRARGQVCCWLNCESHFILPTCLFRFLSLPVLSCY